MSRYVVYLFSVLPLASWTVSVRFVLYYFYPTVPTLRLFFTFPLKKGNNGYFSNDINIYY